MTDFATAGGMTPATAIDRVEAARHPRRQDRRLHARGAVYDARFVPSDCVNDLVAAPQLLTECAAVVRFSNGSPAADADDRGPGIRGMAVKLLDDTGRSVHDLVAANFLVLPSRSPEGFIDIVELLGATSGGPVAAARGVAKLAHLVTKHPESRAGLVAAARAKVPASFATTRYDGLHAFLAATPDGHRRPFRYRLVPQLGEVALDRRRAKTLRPDFLIAELDERLTYGPVGFTVAFQFAEPSDRTDDPSTAWPEHRLLVAAGTIQVSGRSAQETLWQKAVFDPTRLAQGIDVSDDPVLAFRPTAYSVSAERRYDAEES